MRQAEAAEAVERAAEAAATAERLQRENKALADTFNARIDAADRELKVNNDALRADVARWSLTFPFNFLERSF